MMRHGRIVALLTFIFFVLMLVVEVIAVAVNGVR
jgi:hypothetical protein